MTSRRRAERPACFPPPASASFIPARTLCGAPGNVGRDVNVRGKWWRLLLPFPDVMGGELDNYIHTYATWRPNRVSHTPVDRGHGIPGAFSTDVTLARDGASGCMGPLPCAPSRGLHDTSLLRRDEPRWRSTPFPWRTELPDITRPLHAHLASSDPRMLSHRGGLLSGLVASLAPLRHLAQADSAPSSPTLRRGESMIAGREAR